MLEPWIIEKLIEQETEKQKPVQIMPLYRDDYEINREEPETEKPKSTVIVIDI